MVDGDWDGLNDFSSLILMGFAFKFKAPSMRLGNNFRTTTIKMVRGRSVNYDVWYRYMNINKYKYTNNILEYI